MKLQSVRLNFLSIKDLMLSCWTSLLQRSWINSIINPRSSFMSHFNYAIESASRKHTSNIALKNLKSFAESWSLLTEEEPKAFRRCTASSQDCMMIVHFLPHIFFLFELVFISTPSGRSVHSCNGFQVFRKKGEYLLTVRAIKTISAKFSVLIGLAVVFYSYF